MSPTPYPSREFSDKELKISSFFVRNRERLRKIFIISFIVLDAALILGALSGGIFYIIGYSEFNRNLSSISSPLIDWQALRPKIQSRPVTILEVSYVPSGTRTDFIARVQNENKTRWSSNLRYRFIWQGGETEWNETFILPGSSRYLVALGADTVAPNDVRLETTMSWSRVPVVDEVGTAPLADFIVISGERFIGGEEGGFSGGLAFKAENQGPFGYRTVGFTVGVKQGSVWSAIHYITVSDFFSETTRNLEARFLGRSLTPFGAIVVEPELNIFDKENIFLGSFD